MYLCEHSKGEERRELGNVLTCFLHALGRVFMTLLGHSPKMLLEENRSRDQGDIVADPGLTGTCTYQAVESQVLLEVTLCHCPQSSPTLPQERCLQFAPLRWHLETLGKVGCEKSF